MTPEASGLVIVDINDPLKPRVVSEIGAPYIRNARAVQIQFRYAFVCDGEGVKVIDVTDPEKAAAIPAAAPATPPGAAPAPVPSG